MWGCYCGDGDLGRAGEGDCNEGLPSGVCRGESVHNVGEVGEWVQWVYEIVQRWFNCTRRCHNDVLMS